MQTTVTIDFFWDEEAEVYVATSEDVPGLVTEAKTFEELRDKVQTVVPELLIENAHLLNGDLPEKIEMCMLSKFTQNVHASA